MKHMQADKYTIAWFKIADCVSRGEKERALGVYRLLSHSFNDDAIARQLEADIYLACNEQERAISLYRQAVEAYAKSQRFLEAAAVCEHLILLLPHDVLLRSEVMRYYGAARLMSKIYHHIQALILDYPVQNYVSMVMPSLEKVIDFLLQEEQHDQLQDFFVMIKSLDEPLYEHVCAYVKR